MIRSLWAYLLCWWRGDLSAEWWRDRDPRGGAVID